MKQFETTDRYRVLVIDDNETIHADFRKTLQPPIAVSSFAAAKAAMLGSTAAITSPLRPRFEVDYAFQGKEGEEKVRAAVESGDPYLMAFVDMRMPPGWDGIATIKHLWKADPLLQIVICTAFSDQGLTTVAEDLGHTHQLLILKKPFDTVEVCQSAAALCEKRIAQQTASLRMEELERLVQERTGEIEHATLHDKLTGLPNRALLTARLDACIKRHKRNGAQPFALLFLDFDRFKLVNDSLGHEVGDVLLIEIANRLRNSLRDSDLVCHSCLPSRMGGDEFIVLVEDLRDGSDAARVAQRILDVLCEPYLINNQNLTVTASIGVATSDCEYETPGDMIRDADTAMYRAKAAGRAKFVLFDRTMHSEATERLALETDLRDVIQNNGLTLHYQPIVNLANGELWAFEALVRWFHPQRGRIPAHTVISIAEEAGVIQPLTLQVLRLACGQLQSWRRRFPLASDIRMGVNLSPRLLINPDFIQRISSVLEEAGIPADRLALEITENILINEKDAQSPSIGRLKQLGICLHLDDFGTGYSSLSCLNRLPLCGLKIDQSFIREACWRGEQAQVLQSIVSIARALGLKVIAEGVETTEQLQLLRSLDVDYGQGYLFGAPCDAQQAQAVFERRPTLCYCST